MDVKLLPRPVGCLWIPLQIMTLGLVTLILRSAEASFRAESMSKESRRGAVNGSPGRRSPLFGSSSGTLWGLQV